MFVGLISSVNLERTWRQLFLHNEPDSVLNILKFDFESTQNGEVEVAVF
jgi:hypothetical protein